MTQFHTARNQRESVAPADRYKWVALANTTASMFMATLDGSIVIIALPVSSAASTWTRWPRAASATCCG